MAVNQLPEKISLFNVYNKGNKLIGVSGEVKLPDFETATETISVAGILGEFDSPTPGVFGPMEIEIPFISLNESIFSILGTNDFVDLTIRGDQLVSDVGTGSIKHQSVRIVIRGLNKGITSGTLKTSSPTNSSIKLEILYIKIEIAGKPMIELDKLNVVYKVNGIDLLAEVNKNI